MLSPERATDISEEVQSQEANAQSNMMRFVFHAMTVNCVKTLSQRMRLAKERKAIISGLVDAIEGLEKSDASESEKILLLERVVNLQGYERRGLPQFQGLAEAVRPALTDIFLNFNPGDPELNVTFMAVAALVVGEKMSTPMRPTSKSDVEEALSKKTFLVYKKLVSEAHNAMAPQ